MAPAGLAVPESLDDVRFALEELARRPDLQEPVVRGYVVVKVYAPDGELAYEFEDEMHSITAAGLALLLWPLLPYCGNASCSSVSPIYSNTFGLTTPSGFNMYLSFSYQVGSGSQPFSPGLTSLAAPISNGTGAGQLSYSSLGIAVGAGGITFSFTVTNSGPTDVTLSEFGIFANFVGNVTTGPFLAIYETLSSPVTLAPGSYASISVVVEYLG